MAIEFNKPSVKSSSSIGTRRSTGAQAGKSTGASSNTHSGASEKASSGSSGEQVAISSNAQLIQSLEARIQQMPDADSARVEALKQSIEDGSYQVDADSTAQKMLALEQSLQRLSEKE